MLNFALEYARRGWPVLPLCDSCHAEWHNIVTPFKNKREAGQC